MVKLVIFVIALDNKEVKLEVDSSETIAFGKKKYANLLNSSDSFIWKFGGMVLNDNQTFDFYGIENEDRIISNNIKTKKIRIYIKDLKNRSITLEVDPSETIGIAKQMYANLINSSGHFKFKWEAQILKDDKTFEFYGIEDEDVIIYSPHMLG